jgi:serine O-acetyltransferase
MKQDLKSLKRLVVNDLDARVNRADRISFLLSNPGFRCLLLLRLQSYFYCRGNYKIANGLRFRILKSYGLDSVPGNQIGANFRIEHPAGIVIGKGVVIGDNVILAGSVTLGERHINKESDGFYPTLGNFVTVGSGAVIVGNVSVGDNCKIGANSYVSKSIPPGATFIQKAHTIISFYEDK